MGKARELRDQVREESDMTTEGAIETLETCLLAVRDVAGVMQDEEQP